MKAVLVAIGNSFRRDDGAAHLVLELLGNPAQAMSMIQLAPEVSADIAAADRVVFIDASVAPGPARLERIEPGDIRPGVLGHAVSPGEVVTLARALFQFRGEAWLCHVPGSDFEDGEGLSEEAEASARSAAELIRALL